MPSQASCCIGCHLPIKPRQAAVTCDYCSLWQHRSCNTGISKVQYHQAAIGILDLSWKCKPCLRLSNLHKRSPLRRFERNLRKTTKTVVVKEYDESDSETENVQRPSQRSKAPKKGHFKMASFAKLFTRESLKKIQLVKVKHIIMAAGLSLFLILLAKVVLSDRYGGESDKDLHCYADYVNNGRLVCRPRCRAGYYSLPFMNECEKHLNCKEIQGINMGDVQTIGGGAVKGVYLAQWKGHRVAVNVLQNPSFREDFQHGITMLRQFQTSGKVTQLLGYCRNYFVSEYQSLGNALNYDSVLQLDAFKDLNTVSTRFKTCINYVEIVEFFHSRSSGRRVFCDSNSLEDTLKQYLITPNLRLLANDLDALPSVTEGQKIKCGHRAIVGDFAAPEQRYPNDQDPEEYQEDLVQGYDEKVDIWKVPDVCLHFLGGSSDTDVLKLHLFKIHNACKNKVPQKRPNATEVLKVYLKVQAELNLD